MVSHRSMVLFVVMVTASMTTAAPAAQRPGDERAVLQVHEQRNKALLAQDVNALEPILAEEIMWVHSSASIENRSQVLDRVRTGASRWLKVEPRDLKVHVYGTAAVVSGQWNQTTSGPGRPPADRTLQIIEVYAKRSGRWLLVNFQATAVPERGPTR